MKNRSTGFTLAEVATVLVIVGLILGGLLATLPAQITSQRESATKTQLNDAIESLIGYAIANRRLPCPAAAPPAGGQESPIGGGVCTAAVNYTGYLPAATLGLGNVSPQGYLLDSWGNPIRYALTPMTGGGTTVNAFSTGGATAFNGQSIQTLVTSLTNASQPGLTVCSQTNPAKGATSRCLPPGPADTAKLSGQAIAVVWSAGPQGASGPQGADEAENSTVADKYYISHEWRETATAAGGSYHQLVTWLPYSTLFGRMVQAGSLP